MMSHLSCLSQMILMNEKNLNESTDPNVRSMYNSEGQEKISDPGTRNTNNFRSNGNKIQLRMYNKFGALDGLNKRMYTRCLFILW